MRGLWLALWIAMGIKNAIVVGEHIGGKVGLEMAVTWPERVNKLVLSSIGYYQDDAGKKIKDPPNYQRPGGNKTGWFAFNGMVETVWHMG